MGYANTPRLVKQLGLHSHLSISIFFFLPCLNSEIMFSVYFRVSGAMVIKQSGLLFSLRSFAGASEAVG